MQKAGEPKNDAGFLKHIPHSGTFSGGNIFVDFNNQSYLWEKVCG